MRPQPRRGAPLERPREGRKVAGVCLAFARALDWDPNLMRVLWVVITVLFAFVFGVIAYAVAWVLIPEEPALVLAQSDASQPNANGA